ncbi:MAG TPA: ParB N-terminal domain-containing protein [Treponemataceae bacterium]|nr:ParB N-terminal domain-containing protein [Treponemataceae bacterium]
MLISIDSIKIKRRVRKEPDDLEALMESMKRYGLLNPITISSRNILIAGERRLESAKRLGWKSIDAVVLSDTDPISELEMEIEENTQRSNFKEQDLLEGYKRLERMRNPNIFVRIWRALVAFFKGLFAK